MAEQNKTQIFREKSIEAVQSPEALNDYLRVTSPGVWLVLCAVVALLVGGILWGIFGRIDTTVTCAVTARDGAVVCLVPYADADKALLSGVVTVDGEALPFTTGAEYEVQPITDETSPSIRVVGKLEVGDLTLAIPVTGSLPDGVYPGTVVTESLRPISMLIQ